MQFAPPAELLANPVDDFVADFVGADRALKSLCLTRLEEHRPAGRAARERRRARRRRCRRASRAGELEPIGDQVLVSTWPGAPSTGCRSPRSATPTACRTAAAEGLEPVLDQVTTLRDALSALFEANAAYGAVVDGRRPPASGLLSLEVISAASRRHAGAGAGVVAAEHRVGLDLPPQRRHPGGHDRAPEDRRSSRWRSRSAIWVPVGILLRRRRILFASGTTAAGIVYTIPSLALFAFLVPTFGIGRTTVIVGLILYSPLILIRNTVVGLQAVPGPVREAARGMGLTRHQTLMRVELPLALPSIFTGIRIVTVTTVGIATIGVLVGAKGLGTLIYTDGTQPRLPDADRRRRGCIATLLAVVLDAFLLLVERLLTPWARARQAA